MDEILHPKKIEGKNHTSRHRGTENIKTKLNLIKLKVQIEILKDRAIHYTTNT